ncbi:YkgJ family cysteine cluster protein [Clostridium felsineum]|uniref:YkgJ family cysteine cluster protein n=1 Tax=Clostridium felsineum TaxID=36839 RepID=UPI00214D98D7|nr:YkgJ family cysteine cluster protein [Clostridium felsineum]MCR3759798.1 YkgJ family cysteine cluster protein [Clostridium felsineum]
MKLILDNEGKVNYEEIEKNSTVKDLLEAIDLFLNSNPLPCSRCRESCCKKSWSVEMDNVCVNRLVNNDDKLATKFVKNKLVKKENYYRDFDQYVVKKDKACIFITDENLCTIYDKRPVICRLYICTDKSYRYNVVRELIGSTYLEALVLEEEIRNNNLEREVIESFKNPALFKDRYDISLEDIFDYAEDVGWLYKEDRAGLY